MFTSAKVSRASFVKATNSILLSLNVLGALVYLKRAAISWAIPQEQGLNAITGEPFVWAAAILPIVAVFFLLDVTWAAFIVKTWKSRLWVVVAIVWLAVVAIDFAHH